MAIFTAIAAALTLGKIATAIFVSVSMFATSMIVGRIIAKRAMRKAGAGGDGGGRIQLPPATDNKIPVVYGSAYMGGPITAAYLSPDQKTMFYVVSLAENTDNGTISYGDVYYDGKLVSFGFNGAVNGLITNNANPGSAQFDTRVNGKLFIYLFGNGSDDPLNNPLSAYGIMPNWTSSDTMTNCAFAIVKVIYNVDSGTTGLGALTAEIINTENGQSTGVYRPGTAIKDYLTNDRYGCAVPLARVNTASLDALNAYSDELIEYIPSDGDTTPPLPTQARYRINGPLDTADNCLNNLQNLVDSCDSWLQYSELSGEWKVVINQYYPGYPDPSNLFEINDDNLVGGIQINPIDLNDTFNELEVAYPNGNIKDQMDYQVLVLEDYQPQLISPNEAVNRLNITYGLVNNAVQAKYLGLRRLLQSREDLVIAFDTDYSGIQIEAGDVVRITHSIYGWVDKLFRVSQVSEEKKPDGTLGASIVAFEYNNSIYLDNSIQDFIPEFNTGLLDPNVFDAPTIPEITDGNISNSSTSSFNISSNVPVNGTIIYMDFNYGNSSNTEQHLLYRTVQAGPGSTLTANNTVTINVNDIPAGNYYFSTTARNDFAGRQSGSSNIYNWIGPKINAYDPNTGNGGIGPNTIRPNIVTANNFVSTIQPVFLQNTVPGSYQGDVIFNTTDSQIYRWNGSAYTNTVNANVIIGNIVANAVANTGIIGNIIDTQISNLFGNVIQGSMTFATLPNTNIQGTLVANQIAANAIGANQLAANSVYANALQANSVTAVAIEAGSIVAGKLAAGSVEAINMSANSVTANAIAADSITTNKIAAGAVQAAQINVSQLSAITANMGTLFSGNILTANAPNTRLEIRSVEYSPYPLWFGTGTTTEANAKIYFDSAGNAFFAGTLAANIVQAQNIQAGAITGPAFAANIQPVQIVNSLPGSYIGDVLFLTTDDKLYRWNGTNYTASVPSSDITGPIVATSVANTAIVGQIVASQIANVSNSAILGQLTNSQLANIDSAKLIGQVVASQIANVSNASIIGEIVSSQIAGAAITSDKLAANSVIAGKIFTNAVTAGTIAAGAVSAGTIAAGAVTAGTIAANAVTAATIAAGSVEAGKIAANAITAGTIAAGAVVAGTIATNAITATNIQAGAIEADKLAVNSVVAGKIATNAVTAGTIAANAVTATTISAGAITTDKISAGAVQAAQIAVSQLSAITADMGTLTGGTIRTATPPSRRVELSATGSFPLWYGTNDKTAANALFYLDNGGNAVFAGTLNAAGGTIDIDTGAVSANSAYGILKGGRFVQCRDGVPVTFTPPFAPGTGNRVIVTYVGGGLTFSNTLVSGQQYQKFEALNITNTGFTPDLKLSDVTGGALSNVSLAFSNPSALVTKSAAQEAFDQTYTATFNIDVYPESFEFGSFGYADVTLLANTGSGFFAISEPVAYGAGSFLNQSVFGVVTPAGAGTVFALVVNTYFGFAAFTALNLNYTTTDSTPLTVTATPAGVPDVTALVYLL